MKVRVICKCGSIGSVEHFDLNDFIRVGRVTAFFCPLSMEWVDAGHGFCVECRIKHRSPAGNYHTCLFNREHNYEDD